MPNPPHIHRTVESVNLDDADRKLIELLQLDGRVSNRALATAVGMTEVTVASRLKKLITNNAVSVTAMLDWEKAGYEWWVTGHLSCDGRSPAEVARDLGAIDCCSAASVVLGEVDIIASFLIADRSEMSKLVREELPRIRGLRVVGLDLAITQHKYGWAAATFPAHTAVPLRFPNPVVELDEFDHRLIAALIHDSRQSNRELGRQLDVSDATVRAHLRRLTDCGLVRLSAIVDPIVLGTVGSVAFCFLSVDKAQINSVIETLHALPQVWQMSQSFGRFDIEILLVCEDRAELVDVLMTQVRSMEAVQNTSTMEVIEVPHHNYHWARFLS
jgi:Lrp/AsnC family transcriptional regulator for asnA, asnC and gidA